MTLTRKVIVLFVLGRLNIVFHQHDTFFVVAATLGHNASNRSNLAGNGPLMCFLVLALQDGCICVDRSQMACQKCQLEVCRKGLYRTVSPVKGSVLKSVVNSLSMSCQRHGFVMQPGVVGICVYFVVQALMEYFEFFLSQN